MVDISLRYECGECVERQQKWLRTDIVARNWLRRSQAKKKKNLERNAHLRQQNQTCKQSQWHRTTKGRKQEARRFEQNQALVEHTPRISCASVCVYCCCWVLLILLVCFLRVVVVVFFDLLLLCFEPTYSLVTSVPCICKRWVANVTFVCDWLHCSTYMFHSFFFLFYVWLSSTCYAYTHTFSRTQQKHPNKSKDIWPTDYSQTRVP